MAKIIELSAEETINISELVNQRIGDIPVEEEKGDDE